MKLTLLEKLTIKIFRLILVDKLKWKNMTFFSWTEVVFFSHFYCLRSFLASIDDFLNNKIKEETR